MLKSSIILKIYIKAVLALESYIWFNLFNFKLLVEQIHLWFKCPQKSHLKNIFSENTSHLNMTLKLVCQKLPDTSGEQVVFAFIDNIKNKFSDWKNHHALDLIMFTIESCHKKDIDNKRSYGIYSGWATTMDGHCSTALCNLLKKGCRHRKWEIWWNSFTIKICTWWFWMFQNYFVTVFLHISLKSQNSFTNKICIWQLWGVFWPFSPVFLLSNIKTWFFPNKIKVRGSSK